MVWPITSAATPSPSPSTTVAATTFSVAGIGVAAPHVRCRLAACLVLRLWRLTTVPACVCGGGGVVMGITAAPERHVVSVVVQQPTHSSICRLRPQVQVPGKEPREQRDDALEVAQRAQVVAAARLPGAPLPVPPALACTAVGNGLERRRVQAQHGHVVGIPQQHLQLEMIPSPSWLDRPSQRCILLPLLLTTIITATATATVTARLGEGDRDPMAQRPHNHRAVSSWCRHECVGGGLAGLQRLRVQRCLAHRKLKDQEGDAAARLAHRWVGA
jgi:hypothetical protein